MQAAMHGRSMEDGARDIL
ncbi:FitA-like ribbon-helix-helix domain-containing protein [Allopusillimonas ginsengisoli]